MLLKKHLGCPKYVNVKNMLWIISSLLVLISQVAEYLVDVSIKCRIQHWLCPYFFKSRNTMSLNLLPKVDPTTGWRAFLNPRQTCTFFFFFFFFFLSRRIILWIELSWPENSANNCVWHTEPLNSCFDLIRPHYLVSLVCDLAKFRLLILWSLV